MKNRYRELAVGTAAVVLALVATAAMFDGRAAASNETIPLPGAVAIVDGPCAHQCWDTCQGAYHKNFDVGNPMGENDGPEHDSCAKCSAGSTCSDHEGCLAVLLGPDGEPDITGTAFELGDSFWKTLEASDVDGVTAFLVNNAGRAYYNEDRGSIQVIGCDDQLVANVPLSAAVNSALRGAPSLGQ